MKCSSAGVTALGGFICILRAACNEVTLLKCSCDPEGLQSLLQNDVRLLEHRKITERVEPGTKASTTTAQQLPCLVPTASSGLPGQLCISWTTIHGLTGDNCLLAASHHKAGVKQQLKVLPALSKRAARNTKLLNGVRC